MADRPFRLRVLDNLTAALQAISIVNGYKTDLAEAVFRGRLMFGLTDPVPLVSILEAPIPDTPIPTPQGGRSNKGEWTLLIQGFVDDDRMNPSDPAHFLLADVKRVLIAERIKGRGSNPNILSMGNKITDLSIGPGVVRPPEEHVSEKAHFWLSVTITLVENLDDPYA